MSHPYAQVNLESRVNLKSTTSQQSSRLTFKLASPVGSDRFDSPAKTKYNVSLARYSNIHHCVKSIIIIIIIIINYIS